VYYLFCARQMYIIKIKIKIEIEIEINLIVQREY